MKSSVILQIDLMEELELYDWLKSLMQNPIYPDETPEECMFREKLFTALNIVKPQKISPVRELMRQAKEQQIAEDKMWEDDDIPF